MNQEQQEAQATQKQKRPQKNLKNNFDEVGRIKITFYTDPLCCWSWAFEESWRKLLAEHGDAIQFEYVLCGMIPDWNSYNDPMNSVSKPIQMGPVWMHASEVTHVKMKHSIWFEDPPSSSYPACIAVKTVGLQSKSAEHEYLCKIRKALMEDGVNISRKEALFSIASELTDNEFSYGQFVNDWTDQQGVAPFREDVKKARFHNIGRYPTLTFTAENGKGIIITGYRPYDALLEAFSQAKRL